MYIETFLQSARASSHLRNNACQSQTGARFWFYDGKVNIFFSLSRFFYIKSGKVGVISCVLMQKTEEEQDSSSVFPLFV